MAVDFLPDADDRLLLHPRDLLSLKDAGVSGGAFAMRPLKKAHLDQLLRSDPQTWPPILVTRCTQGYIVIDGSHRWQVAEAKGARLHATCKPFQTDEDVIKEAFRSNLTHGLTASRETRSDYAYWLHVTYPKMTQAAIADEVGLKQPTVSAAIALRTKQIAERTAPMTEEARERAEQQQRIEKVCHTFIHTALKLLETAEALDDAELFTLLNEMAKTSEDKAKLAQIGRLLTTGTTTGSLLRLAQMAHSSPH